MQDGNFLSQPIRSLPAKIEGGAARNAIPVQTTAISGVKRGFPVDALDGGISLVQLEMVKGRGRTTSSPLDQTFGKLTPDLGYPGRR